MRESIDFPRPSRRPRPWLIVLPLAAVAVLALAWTGFWFFAASSAQTMFTGWRAREAAAGRAYRCASEDFGGFPFRFELRCVGPTADLRSTDLPLALKAKDLVIAAQAYQPSQLIGELTGPLTIAEPGQTPAFAADWTLAQASARGTPSSPERISLVFDQPKLDRLGNAERLAAAEHLELHARQAPRLPQDDPVFDLAIAFSKAVAPPVPQLAGAPVDGQISAVLRGLRDFSAKPWRQRLRELQAANGRLEITSARVQQGDILAVGAGVLSLSPQGRLDGEIRLTVAGLDQLVVALGLDRAAGRLSQNAVDRLAPGLNLDRLLGGRGNAAIAAAGMAMLGQPAELEGRRAVTLPLRFADGAIYLGPLLVRQLAPLY